MTRRELVLELARARGMRPAEARVFVDALVRTIERALTEGDSVTLRRFGTFSVRARAGRMVRAPGAQESVRVPSRLAPVFRSAAGLRERLGTTRQRQTPRERHRS